MYFKALEINNLRGFVGSHNLDLSPNINLFVGPNNAGKTTILNALLLPQNQRFAVPDISFGKTTATILISFEDHGSYIPNLNSTQFQEGYQTLKFTFSKDSGSPPGIVNLRQPKSNQMHFSPIPNAEPENAIYPSFSKRKVSAYVEDIGLAASRTVTGTLQNLYAKVDRLSDPNFLPPHQEYVDACDAILGFRISAVPSENGKRAAFHIRNLENIPITSMGEGVPSLLGLVVDLCMTDNGGKIFILEEPENDIHPKALRALLNLIESKSAKNQFFISTHSNIVAKHLGSVPQAKVFKILMSFNDERLPRSTVTEVSNEEGARRELLEELGYEFQDYDLHKAWLFMEESSAEVVVREFLIPTFAKGLAGKLKTFSANGVDKVKVENCSRSRV